MNRCRSCLAPTVAMRAFCEICARSLPTATAKLLTRLWKRYESESGTIARQDAGERYGWALRNAARSVRTHILGIDITDVRFGETA